MKATTTRRRFGVAAVAIACAVAGGLTLASCGSTEASGDNEFGTVDAGHIKFAFRSDDKPVSFVQNGKPTGFMIELTRAMAEKMGLEPSYVATDFASMLPNVRNHKYDSAAFGTLVTPERQEVCNFTAPVSYGQARLISRKAASIESVRTAGGKTVAITRGSALIPLLRKKTPDVVIKEFPNVASSANALTAGQVDGLFTGTATTLELLDKHPDFIATESVTSGVTAFPVAKDRPELKTALDDALAAVIDDGTYTALFDKWNPSDVAIPQDMLDHYPGMKQRPGIA